MITPIEGLGAITPARKNEESKYIEQTQGSVFGTIFKNAIENVVQTDAEVAQGQYLLSTGQLDNPASLMIAITKESTAVNLLVQLRNKALDAYSELSRMSV